nr:septal ring lytic transglycosylase RlpA family protein [Polymorphobacter sp.]
MTRLLLRYVSLAILLVLGACATSKHRSAAIPAKIGKPYQVLGTWYYPSDDRDYDQRGIASWYGPGFHALSTANGERYNQDDVTAAHKTLPMPSFVEVENLDNGRKLTIRVNDRGPFVAGRIIDLSRRSAQLLGVDKAGTAKVRVRRVFPKESEIARLASSPSLTTFPQPVKIPTNSENWKSQKTFIQVAALGDPGRIAWLKGYLGSFGPVVLEPGASGLTRVRLGPYADAESANATLAQLRAAGYSEARLVPSLPNP